MAFRFFDDFSKVFDNATATFATDISSKLIATLTPVISVGLTLGFLVYAFGIIRGAIDHPMPDFLWRCFRIGVIVSIATAGGLYQSQIAEAITSTPDALAKALISGPSGSTAGSIYDSAAQKALDVASKAFEKQGWFSSEGWLYGAFGIMFVLATVIIFGIGAGFIILAKVALAILAAFGPLFIFALLWQPTARLFESWVAQVLNYGFVIVLTSAIFMLVVNVFGNYMGGVTFDGSQNAAYVLAAALMICLVSILLLLQVPSIAGGLAGGVGLGYMWEMRMLRSGVGSFGRKGSDGRVSGRSGMLGAASMASGAGAAGARGMYSAGKKIAGYARGKFG